MAKPFSLKYILNGCLVLTAIFLSTQPIIAQGEKTQWFKAKEDTLRELGHTAISSPLNSEKKSAAEKISTLLMETLKHPDSWTFGFDSVKYISVVASPDNRFRIFTWYYPDDAFEHHYFGILQVNQGKKPPVLTLLKDAGDSIADPSKEILSADNWLGTIYYSVIAQKKNNRSYILLGWDGHNPLINRKIIEVLTISSRGEPKFGGNQFRNEANKPVKRVIFQYGENASMSLRYHEKEKLILFDHLAPTDPNLKENFEYYGPDMSYDGYLFENGRWIYIKDVDARNPSSRKKYHQPDR